MDDTYCRRWLVPSDCHSALTKTAGAGLASAEWLTAVLLLAVTWKTGAAAPGPAAAPGVGLPSRPVGCNGGRAVQVGRSGRGGWGGAEVGWSGEAGLQRDAAQGTGRERGAGGGGQAGLHSATTT